MLCGFQGVSIRNLWLRRISLPFNCQRFPDICIICALVREPTRSQRPEGHLGFEKFSYNLAEFPWGFDRGPVSSGFGQGLCPCALKLGSNTDQRQHRSLKIWEPGTFERWNVPLRRDIPQNKATILGSPRIVARKKPIEGFDPGSERTLAAWFRHASRARK